MSFTTQSYKEPFWAQSADFISGRDPLGIQNSSVSLYARLLPGLTNLTERIRYYGFYAWVLKQHELLDQKDPFKKDVRSQYNFIRRSEWLFRFKPCHPFRFVSARHSGSNRAIILGLISLH